MLIDRYDPSTSDLILQAEFDAAHTKMRNSNNYFYTEFKMLVPRNNPSTSELILQSDCDAMHQKSSH